MSGFVEGGWEVVVGGGSVGKGESEEGGGCL